MFRTQNPTNNLFDADEMLSKARAEANELFFEAVKKRELSTVKMLFRERQVIPDMNFLGRNEKGEKLTALMLASANNDLPIVTYLLERGAEVDYTHDEYHTALVWAAKQERLGMIRLLIEYGAGLHGSSLMSAIEFLARRALSDSNSSNLTLRYLLSVCLIFRTKDKDEFKSAPLNLQVQFFLVAALKAEEERLGEIVARERKRATFGFFSREDKNILMPEYVLLGALAQRLSSDMSNVAPEKLNKEIHKLLIKFEEEHPKVLLPYFCDNLTRFICNQLLTPEAHSLDESLKVYFIPEAQNTSSCVIS